MSRLLIISHDVIDTRMAGSGTRYWEMAGALARVLDVTLATPGHAPSAEAFATCAYMHRDWDTLAPAITNAEVLLLDGYVLAEFPGLVSCGKPLVMEATCPYGFETLHQFSDQSPIQQMADFRAKLEITRQVARAGDFFFSANERQRDYWLGVLDAVGRVNPTTYACDSTLHRLIDVVPFGLPSRRPEYHGPVIRGVIPGIAPTDRLILWGGGLWQWLDPLSLVRAVARLAETRKDVRLLFPGTQHPNPIIHTMPMLQETRDLCDRLGLTDKVAFFGDWIPYRMWASYLLEADIGVSMHLDTLETRFSSRTRILDYIWAELPMVVTGGDATSELVARFNLGHVVPPGDDQAISGALDSLLKTPNLREALRPGFEEARSGLTWEKVCEPIARFCAQPRFARDRVATDGSPCEATWAAPLLRAEQQCAPTAAQLEQQQNELQRLRALVQGYEQGRFIRLTRWFADRKSGWRSKWSP
jgi:hypothetical protein